MRIAGPATEQTWVGDAEGDPVMVLTAAPSQSLAAELHRLLPDLRALVGPDRRCTVVFDRGGYSPQVFVEILAAGFDLLTYFKGPWTRADLSAFTTVDFTGPDGIAQTYQLAERPIVLPVAGQQASPGCDTTTAGTVTLHLIIRCSPDGHQTPILTNRTDLSAAEIAYRMSNRWRQENYFKYGREHFALGALDSYTDQPDDLGRLVPNPAKARAVDKVHGARHGLTGAHADMAHALDTAAAKAGRRGYGGKALVDPAAGLALRSAQADLASAKKTSRGTPSHLPLGLGPTRQSATGDRTQTPHPRHPDERLQQRERPRPATRPALRPQRARRPGSSPRSVHPARRPASHRRHPARPARPRLSPAAQQSPRRPLHRTQHDRHPLPKHRPDPQLQRQRPPRPHLNNLTMSGHLEAPRVPHRNDLTMSGHLDPQMSEDVPRPAIWAHRDCPQADQFAQFCPTGVGELVEDLAAPEDTWTAPATARLNTTCSRPA